MTIAPRTGVIRVLGAIGDRPAGGGGRGHHADDRLFGS
jgi:hypothetical protein